MSTTTKSFVSASGVIAAVAVVLVGFNARQHSDLGGGVRLAENSAGVDHMVASRTDDVNVPAGDYFYELSQKLKEQYVEPVSDDNKLVSGAVRGMVASLQDPQSLYMDAKQFKAFLAARDGQFEGIGADFDLVTGPKAVQAEAVDDSPGGETTAEDAMATRDIPQLQVVSVVPGGPADKAQVKVGDIVYSVDGHWLANSDVIRKFRKAQRDFNAKKIPMSELNVMRKEIRSKAETAILPLRAKDELFLGKTGTVTVVWQRGATQRTTKIAKAASELPGFTVKNETIILPFLPSSADQLKSAIAGKSAITIDLRNNTQGDLASMKKCMEVLAPKGNYGNFVTYRHDKPTPLTVYDGNANPPKITLITDKSTRGVAEIFALALSSRGKATLTGSETGGDRDNRSIFKLPDGSGYTLVTSIYKPMLGSQTASAKGGVK